jgi:hypothetical protein
MFWTAATNAPYTPYLTSIASSAEGSTLAATTYDWVHNSGATYVSTNSGGTWSPTYLLALAVACSADGTKLILAGIGPYVGPGLISVSTNSGDTWTATSAPITNWSCVAASADGTKLFAGASKLGGPFWSAIAGPIYRSPDSGATWIPTASPDAVWTSIAASADGTKLAAAGSGSVYNSVDSGANWISNNVPGPGMLSVASSADGKKLVAAGGGGIYTSTNSGAGWTASGASLTNWTSVASSADGNNLVAVIGGGGIFHAQTTPASALDMVRSDTSAAISWIVPSMDFVLQQNADWTTTNWTDLPTPPVLNLTNLQYQMAIPTTNVRSFYRLKQ